MCPEKDTRMLWSSCHSLSSSSSPIRSVGENTVARLEVEPADKFPSTSVRPLVSATADLEESTAEYTLGIGGEVEGLAISTETIWGENCCCCCCIGC